MLNCSCRLGPTICALVAVIAAPSAGRAVTQSQALGSDPGRPVTQGAPAGIDTWLARAMKTFEVPGLALTIVKDGELVVAKGYGVRKVGDQTAVDARTLFGIGSNTQGVHRHRARPARRGRQAPLGRTGHRLPAVVPSVRRAFVTFSLNPDATIDRALMRAVSPETDFSFDFQDLVLRPVR